MNKKSVSDEKTENLETLESGKETKQESKKEHKKKKPLLGKFYLGYAQRVAIYGVAFLILIGLSAVFFTRAFHVSEATVTNYNESGTLDYKVYLKPNEFYEEAYLGKNRTYIASLINSINVDLNYQFRVSELADMKHTYEIIGKLTISGDGGKNTLYEEEYVLKSKTEQVFQSKNMHYVKDTVGIDYDYYNDIANRFKSTYGVDATSTLTVYARFTKDVTNEEKAIDIKEMSEMSLTIPLSQRTLNISINDTAINNSRSIVNESETKFTNIASGVISGILFILSVAAILRTIELIFLLFPKTSKYDKYVKKILTEYDRLIVETPTEPNLEGKEIIRIKRFEELLDARDNLKRPIMYHNINNHQKCYFYIQKEDTYYLFVVKAADLDNQSKKK